MSRCVFDPDLKRRLAADEERGDLGSMRRRLSSRLKQVGYEVGTCLEIARISEQMGDLLEAGRWHFVAGSEDERAATLIHEWLKSCGGIEKAWGRVPFREELRKRPIPKSVMARLEAMGKAPALTANERVRRAMGASKVSLGAVGRIAIFWAAFGVFVIGLVQVIRWVWP